jgi:8-amino-7-oxononanoate synthase
MGAKKINQLELLNKSTLVGIPIKSMKGRVLQTPFGDTIDYCTTNYLGFDYRNELHERGSVLAGEWGNLVGTSRLEADAEIFSNLEERISRWLGAKEVILGHTITVTGFSCIPKLVGKGLALVDSKLHTVVYEACRLAKGHGATLDRFNHQDLQSLEDKLKEHRDLFPKIVAVDGVYSISSERAPIPEMVALCEKYNAFLYVDDAHGFGVLGRNSSVANPYGQGGRGTVDLMGTKLDRVFYVSSFAKAFCTHYAFIAVPHAYEEMLRENCMQYIFSTPPSPYSIGQIEAVLDLNDKEGDFQRRRLLSLTQRFVSGLKSRGMDYLNDRQFPIVFWKIGSVDRLAEVATAMYKKGVMAGLRAYPVVPPDECGIRFGLTALHTEEQIDKTLGVIDELIFEFGLSKARISNASPNKKGLPISEVP